MIPEDILSDYSPAVIELAANSFLFQEGEGANFYYQIISGKLKMININAEGKEFVQGQFEEGQSFGEPPLFHNSPYPASAMTVSRTKLYKLSKEKFLDLLRSNPEIHLQFTTMLTKRMMYKAMIMKEISSHDAQHRILTFVDYLKAEYGSDDGKFTVDLTRQQLSNMLGIRVETVIRTVKQLVEQGEIVLEGRKIIR